MTNLLIRKDIARNRNDKRFTIVVVAEGARPEEGNVVVQKIIGDGTEPVRLGGIGFVLGECLEKLTDIETRTVVMGHLQRGGPPTSFDRILGTQLGVKTVDLIENEEFGYMAGVKGNGFVKVSLELVAKGARLVPSNHILIKSAHSLGTCFGDIE